MISIQPLHDLVNKVSHYNTYDGNLNLTPIDVDKGAIVFQLLSFSQLSTPVYKMKRGNTNDTIARQGYILIEFSYQMDIVRTQHLQPQRAPAPPFEIEVVTIVNAINQSKDKLASDYGFCVGNITTRLWLDTITSRPAHVASCTFTITALDLLPIIEYYPKVECITPNLTKYPS